MDLIALRAELLAGHPVTGAYAADPQNAANEINAVNRTRDRVTMSAGEIMEAIDGAEFAALNAANKTRVDRVLGLGAEIIIGPGNAHNAVQELLAAFGAPSTTAAALAAMRAEPVSRAVELGLGNVRAGEIISALQ